MKVCTITSLFYVPILHFYKGHEWLPMRSRKVAYLPLYITYSWRDNSETRQVKTGRDYLVYLQCKSRRAYTEIRSRAVQGEYR